MTNSRRVFEKLPIFEDDGASIDVMLIICQDTNWGGVCVGEACFAHEEHFCFSREAEISSL